MPTLNMGDTSYGFASQIIEKTVEEGRAGNYALGYLKDSTFHPKYVGRSDSDLQAELKAKLPTKSQTRQRFKCSYARSSREAFEKECRNYHDFSGLENENHPPRPEGQGYPCPVCNAFD